MAVIGQADIIIGADASRFAGDAERQTKSPMARLGTTLASAMGTTLKIGTTAIATGVGAVLGVAISQGMGRLAALDSAEARMKGLGYSGVEVEGIMSQVADAVLGTYFSTADMASAASQMLTSGVEPGKELDGVLAGISGTAAATGADIGDITAIWQKMASSGKVTGSELHQLSTRGMNGLKALADHFGITQEEASEMVTAGKVSFEDFNEAIVGNTDEMVEEMSKSYEALKATAIGWLGMAGEQLVGPFFEAAKALLPAINDLLEPVPDAIKSIMAPVKTNMVEWAEGVATALGNIDVGAALSSFSDGLSKISGLLAPLAGLTIGALGPMMSNIPVIGRMFTGLTGPVGLVIGLFISMFQNSEDLREAFGAIMSTLGEVMKSLAPAFGGMSSLIEALAGALGDILASVIMSLLPLIEAMAEILGPVLGIALTAAAVAVEFLADVLVWMLDAVGNSKIALGVLAAAVGVWAGIQAVAAAETLYLTGLIVAENVAKFASATATGVMAVATKVAAAAQWLFNAAILANPLTWLVIAIAAAVAGLIWFFTQTEAGQAIVTAVWDAIKAAIGAVVDWWTDTAVPAFLAAWDWFKDGITSGSDSIGNAIEWMSDTFGAAWDFIDLYFLTPFRLGFGLLKSIFTGDTEHIKDAWSGVQDRFMSVWEAIKTGVFDPLVAAWNWVAEGFMIGVETQIKPAWEAVSSAAQWLWGILKPIFEGIISAFTAVGGFIMDVVKNVLLLAWDLVAFAAKWLWESVLKPVFSKIGDFWDRMVRGMKNIWDNVLKPAWDAVAAAAQWLWNNVLKPVFTWIGNKWRDTLQGIKNIWNNVLKPTWDYVRSKADWLWGVLKGIFTWIGDKWKALSTGIRTVFRTIISAVWDSVSSKASWLWGKLTGFFDRIKSIWTGLGTSIRNVWNNSIKPVWNTVASFVQDTLVGGVRRGIDQLDRAWRRVANMFRTPINWVINTVWNNGLKKAFDNVASAVNSTATLPSAPNIPRFADGGQMKSGWKLVGEEGPELIKTGPGWVHDARETKKLLADPMKNPLQDFSPGNPPHGGPPEWLKDAWVSTKGVVTDAAGAVVDWARGGLADMAGLVLDPLFGSMKSGLSTHGPMGELGGDTMVKAKDELLDWIRGKDDEAGGPWTGMSDVGGRSLRGAKPHVKAAAFTISDAIQPGMFMQAFNQSMKGAHGLGLAVDFMAKGGNLQKTADFMVANHKKLNGLWEVIYNHKMWTKGRGWRGLSGGMGNDPGHVWHVHGGWGAQKYDTGGVFGHGQSAINLSGKPEAILTNAQWGDFSTLVATLRKGQNRMSVPEKAQPVTAATAVQVGGEHDWSKDQMDYLAGKIATMLWPMARAADHVNDFASMGQTRRRMGA